ncbi:MAG: hypothetical protein E7591_07490 [Ruminococcaceae bacterium]|nr:hypothetical protein [Oscillospiraceae bacterium]
MKVRSLILALVLLGTLLLSTGISLSADNETAKESVSADGVIITVHGLDDVRDFYISKGSQTVFSKVKENMVVQISSKKIGDATEYSYTVKDPGDYTILIRHNDTSIPHTYLYITLEVIRPEFTENGLQIKIANLDDVKVVRSAYGDYNSMGDIKRAAGSRAFTAKTIGSTSPYTVQYRENGRVTVGVAYNNGYYEIYKYDVEKKVPVFTQNEDTVTFTELDGLKVLRYAKGEYTTSSEIKKAAGSVALKPSSIVNGEISLKLDPGTYTFCVQYDDESYNYYTVTVIDPNIPTAKGIHVSNAFKDDMVLQRDEKLTVWGTAESKEGTTVLCEINGERVMAKVDATGNWTASFDKTFPYSAVGTQLKVSCAEGHLEFNNILFGDVYYLMGGDNVSYSIAETEKDIEEAGASGVYDLDYDESRNIRFFRMSGNSYNNMTGEMAKGTTTEYTDVYNGAEWMTPSDIVNGGKTYSALGYMFAYNLSKVTDVPIGVIEIDVPDAMLMSFAPNSLADKWGNEAYDSASGTYYYVQNEYQYAHTKTRYAYNQLINPLKNFSTAGIIWYHGEYDIYNTRDAQGLTTDNYAIELSELFSYFRSVFGNNDFPVYIMELPVCYSNNNSNNYVDFGGVRSELGTVPQLCENTYVVSTSDLFFDPSYYDSLHLPIKHLLSYRAADVVKADKYGIGSIDDVCGPVLSDVIYEGNSKAYLYFENTGASLTTSDLSGYVKGLEILVELNGELHWIPHEGEIIMDYNMLTVDAGSFKLCGVRYGRNTEHTTPVNRTLCNAHKMPAVAFVDYNYGINKFITMSIDSTGWDIYTPRNYTDYNYRYGPTIITNEDGSMDAWFSCTGSSVSGELDYFSYKHSDDGGKSWGEEKIVLSPTGLSKDRLSVCDPAAIYFNGYYYLGYTSTLDKGGYTNHGFVARSKNPDGPYEKWNGKGWGGLPEPIITYNGRGDQWGMGELSFVVVEDRLYIYYSLKCESGQYTYVTTADASNENWPLTITEGKRCLKWGYGQAAADVKYDRASGLFVAAAIVNGNSNECYMALFTSEDGFDFIESSRSSANMKSNAMNNGISAGPDGTFDSNTDKLYIAYAYGQKWGCWATRIAPVTLNISAYPSLKDKSATDSTLFKAYEGEKEYIGITTESHYYIIEEGSSFNVNAYIFDDEMRRTLITNTEGFEFSAYEEGIVSFNGMTGNAVKTGKTVVAATYDKYYVTFTVEVREKGSDTVSSGAYSFEAWSDVINVKAGSDHQSAIRGILTTCGGLIGEAYNDTTADKVIFTQYEYPVIYSGYDPNIIHIDMQGNITPLSFGSTEVTVTVSGQKSFKVTVNVIS